MTMAQNDQVPELAVDAEGAMLKCAKGLGTADCGFVPKSAVCGKCGAVPVEMKMLSFSEYQEIQMKAAASVAEAAGDAIEVAVEEVTEEKPKKKKRYRGIPMEERGTDEAEADEMAMDAGVIEEEDEEPGEEAEGETPEEEATEEEPTDEQPEETEEEPADEESEDEPELETEEDDSGMDDSALERLRKARLQQLGVKVHDAGIGAYRCAIDGKIYPGGTPPCADCPGGCAGTKGEITILHAEGISQTLVKGDVLQSAYVPEADIFSVTLRRKDAKVFDVFVHGTSGEIVGHRLLDGSTILDPSSDDLTMVTFDEAAAIAKSWLQKDGEVVSIVPGAFEGIDSYVVDIQCKDGKAHDVYVSLDGNILGVDTLEEEDILEVEADAAEIALKVDNPPSLIKELAATGVAMKDGSLPIRDENDLINAMRAYPRAKDLAGAKAHIVSRAKALGLKQLLPEPWQRVGESAEIAASLAEFEKLSKEILAD